MNRTKKHSGVVSSRLNLTALATVHKFFTSQQTGLKKGTVVAIAIDWLAELLIANRKVDRMSDQDAIDYWADNVESFNRFRPGRDIKIQIDDASPPDFNTPDKDISDAVDPELLEQLKKKGQ